MSNDQITPKLDGRKKNGGARAGAGKPKQHPEDTLKLVPISLYPRTWRELANVAKRQGVSQAALIRQMLEAGLTQVRAASDLVEGGGGIRGNTGTD